MSVTALSENEIYDDLWSLKDESEMGHIQLSRQADLVLVAPATANILAKMAQGISDDLASTTLMATNRPVLVAPAMNVEMWNNAATQDNVTTLKKRGIEFIGPNAGDMACGETGEGRLAEPDQIAQAIEDFFNANAPLKGKKALVTSGPTYEPIDPVRFIGNRSSGKQGHAIAQALALAGAETILVSGPTNLPNPVGVKVVNITTAEEMLAACENNLPTDIAVCAAAVADWKVKGVAENKIKKDGSKKPPQLELEENPDILATISKAENRRPQLVVGFAAETENVINKATDKLARKKCDWIVANDVSAGTDTFGGENNTVHLLRNNAETENWPEMTKEDVARELVEKIIEHFGT